jgi:hypothetical protein
VLAAWHYLGCGYLNPGDVLLAAGVEASIRIARESGPDSWARGGTLPTDGVPCHRTRGNATYFAVGCLPRSRLRIVAREMSAE